MITVRPGKIVGKDVITTQTLCLLLLVLLNSGKRSNKVYAGTEPSALYTSNDGGTLGKGMAH